MDQETRATVTVTVAGGVVQNVDFPAGVRVVVRDYDVEGCNESDLTNDENGNKYLESVWE